MSPKLPSKARQEKVTLRETPMGSRVINRLALPNIDKSAELRRLIELGIACELAGFILDGETLRQGGRVWEMQPHRLDSLPANAAAISDGRDHCQEAQSQTRDRRGKPQQPVKQQASDPPEQASPVEGVATAVPVQVSPMLVNLRSLSAT